MSEHTIAPEDQMMQWITAKWITKPIYVAAELGIADLLRNGPLSSDALAQKTNTHPPTLYRLLRALSAVGIFVETDHGIFGLTPLSQCLLSEAMRPLARMFLSHWHDKVWDQLIHTVKTGQEGFQQAFGQKAFQWMEENPEVRAVMDQAQARKATGFARAAIEAHDFSGYDTICDVGGGQGAFLIQLLANYPHLKGLVADLPQAAAYAQKEIAKAGLNHRCKAIAYDFLREKPPQSDAYLLVNILHDWEDDICQKILTNVSHAMHSHTKLWVVEYLIEPTPGFSVAKLLDLEVLVMGGGRERSIGEYKELLNSSGLALSKAIPTKHGPTLLKCHKKQ